MPFDPVIGVDTDPATQPRSAYETAGSEFVPDLWHISEHVVALADGSLLAVIKVPGYPFELESMRTRNIRRRQLNSLFRGIADTNVTVGVHLCRHPRAPEFAWGPLRTKFARELFRAYQHNCLDGRLVSTDWFLTVVVKPRFIATGAIRRYLKVFGWEPKQKEAPQSLIKQMDAVLRSLMSYLRSSGARLLGYRLHDGWMRCSEIAEARRLMLMGRWAPVPLTTGLLGSAIYNERVTCGTRAVRIDGLDGPRYAKTIALKDYPAEETRTGQFSGFVSMLADEVAFPFVMSQTIRFQGREETNTRLYLKGVRMQNAFDPQEEELERLSDARSEVAGGKTVRGYHNWGVTVFARSLDELHTYASTVGSAVVAAGTAPIQEDGGSFGAYWSALPGNPEWLQGRSGSISTRNFTAFASMDGFPIGDRRGYWGKPIMRFATSGHTAYDFVPHVADIGHALFLGRSTSGKTLLMMLLMTALQQVKGRRGMTVCFDKDEGMHPAILANGGVYLRLRAGEPSGIAPLRGLADTSENQAFLVQWLSALMLWDGAGPLKPRTINMLPRAVARQMRLPPEKRSLGGVRAFLGFGEGYDGSRLDRWCAGKADGWLFDSEVDEVRMDAPIVGFDMTRLLEHPACPLVAMYLLQRVREIMDGRRLTVIADEVRFYLLHPMFEEMITDFALTLRKKEGQLWLAAQEPAHIINAKVGAALANQAQTMWLYPTNDASPEEYEKLGCTAPMYKALTETMRTLPYRTVLLKRESGSAVLRVELTGMEDQIAVLSGRERRVRLIPGILARVGNDPDKFYDAFIRAVRELKEEDDG